MTLSHWIDQFEAGNSSPEPNRPSPRGLGTRALCNGCNSRSWYVSAFKDFVDSGRSLVAQIHRFRNGDVSPITRATGPFPPIDRLAVSKQIVTMLLAINGPDFGDGNPELRTFVRDRHALGIAPRHHLGLVLILDASLARSCPLSVRLNSEGMWTVTELAFQPFAYVMTFGDAPHPHCLDITDWTNSPPGAEQIVVDLPAGSLSSPFPCDYRYRSQVLRATEKDE